MFAAQWDRITEVLTCLSIESGFMETFKNTASNEKVALCTQSDFIRNCLEQWLDGAKFDESLKNPVKSKEVRIKANEHFKKNQLELCFKLYTQAAQLAPCKSMELAISFSNRSAVFQRWNKFHDCLKDIDTSLDILENDDVNDKEVNKGDIIVKLLKRKITCFIALKQYKKGQTCWKYLLELSKNVYKMTLEEQFIEKCKVLSYYDNDYKIIPFTKLTEDLIKKSLEKNKIILPYKSPKLKLCVKIVLELKRPSSRFHCTESKGRHFVAATKIEYGELLIFENPFAFVLLSSCYDKFCYNCCVLLDGYSVPCDNCCTILFCGEKCRNESWDSYHRWECKQGLSIFKDMDVAHLGLRLTLETSNPESKNDQINNFLTHIDDFKTLALYKYTLTATLLFIYLQKKTDFFEKQPTLDQNSVGNELLYHMTIIQCNGCPVSTHVMADINSESIIEEPQPLIGTAIFPTSSLLNHSCDPNIFSSNILKYIVIKASRDIEKGEEVTNCYGPNFRNTQFVDRQTSLKELFHFDCKCFFCMDPHKDNLHFQKVQGLVCLSCNNEIQATLADLDEYDTIRCDLCYTQFRSSDYKKHLIRADKKYNKGIKQLLDNNILNAENKLLESLRLYTLVLSQKNPYIMNCEHLISRCFAISGDFENCYIYLDKNIQSVEENFGENSLHVAYRLDKITDILVYKLDIRKNWSLIKRALAYVRRSLEIFHAHLSAWDIPYSVAGLKNVKYKEHVLLMFLENRS